MKSPALAISLLTILMKGSFVAVLTFFSSLTVRAFFLYSTFFMLLHYPSSPLFVRPTPAYQSAHPISLVVNEARATTLNVCLIFRSHKHSS